MNFQSKINHVAIIMDGNKRWSENNNVSLKEGYIKGFYKIEEVVEICLNNNIKYLTLYALSSENIKRKSVSLIFDILLNEYKFLSDSKFLNDVKINIIGEKSQLSKEILNIIKNIEIKSNLNNKLILNIAFNYGTDKEIISIIKKILKKNLNNENDINTNLIREEMYLSGMPDPDILIRTGGYQRLSNFLLINLSYTELFFTKTLWPDLTKNEIDLIFNKFNKIKRNYGL